MLFPLVYWGFPGSSVVKNPLSNAGDAGWIPGWEDPWRRKRQPTPAFSHGKFHKQRNSMEGYSTSSTPGNQLFHAGKVSELPASDFCLLSVAGPFVRRRNFLTNCVIVMHHSPKLCDYADLGSLSNWYNFILRPLNCISIFGMTAREHRENLWHL